jgi:predicted nucleic acid-binding protein
VEIAVPALLYYEVANILLFGRSRPPIAEAAEALGDLFSIPLVVAAPEPDAGDAAFRLASNHGLSYYDASYIALAETLDCILLTADQRWPAALARPHECARLPLRAKADDRFSAAASANEATPREKQ